MSEAIEFQVMPPLSMEEYNSLHDSIEQNGIQVPVVVDETGTVIDGHHRKKIATELGIDCPRSIKSGLDATAKRTLALSLNLDRRHLNREQRRELIAASIKADPQLPDLQHAQRTGASDKTVTSMRREMEGRSEIPNVVERTDSLGRSQPATKPERALSDEPGQVSKLTGSNSAASISGMDGGDYPRPVPRAEPHVKRRPSILDQTRNAGWELRKSVERIQRIQDDDRYTKNEAEIIASLRPHLDFAQEVLNNL